MKNIFTVDLEDWCFIPENNPFIKKGKEKEYIENLYRNVRIILELLESKKIKATFFVLGKLAENVPEIVKEVKIRGHEIACHGYQHKNITEMKKDEFKKDLELSLNAIFSSCGVIPIGFRAPNFSINKNNIWALNILKEFGFIYDSSIYPVKYYSGFGRKEISMSGFVHDSGIVEIPLSCADLFHFRLPCSGGAYFRFIPFDIFKFLLRKINSHNRNFIFYIHPWELLNSLPKNGINSLSKIRKFYNINKIEKRLNALIEEFEFCSIEEYLKINFNL
ncbi:MAG: DUF3473 domain-containing protein [Bacteroidetes bacterium]|nr:MAG: DUF3473 domain-containing protein [Bacteroidota bacterium]